MLFFYEVPACVGIGQFDVGAVLLRTRLPLLGLRVFRVVVRGNVRHLSFHDCLVFVAFAGGLLIDLATNSVDSPGEARRQAVNGEFEKDLPNHLESGELM